MEQLARTEAQSRLKGLAQAAGRRLAEELARRLDRLTLEAERGGERERLWRATEMVQEQQFAGSVREALRTCRLVLDSAAVVVVEPSATKGDR